MKSEKTKAGTAEPASKPHKSVTASKKVSQVEYPAQQNMPIFFHHFFKYPQDYEYVWKLIFVIVSGVTILLIYKIYLFQTMEIFDEVRRGSIWKILVYSMPFAVTFGIIDNFIHLIFDPLCDKYYVDHKTFPSQEVRAKRCYTLVKWGYSIFYYAISSVAGYLILQNTYTMPTFLGGEGTCMNMYADSPAVGEYTFAMHAYYVLQFGKHCSRAFSHIFIRPEGNYYEYALHHGLSVFLIMYSYLMNFWLVGVWVLFLHDVSDFFLTVGRAYREYKNRNELLFNTLASLAVVSWIGSRIVLFCSCCIWPSIYGVIMVMKKQLTPIQIQVLSFPIYFMVAMLIILEIMHLFWTYYIGRSFIGSTITTKVAHNYD